MIIPNVNQIEETRWSSAWSDYSHWWLFSNEVLRNSESIWNRSDRSTSISELRLVPAGDLFRA